MRVFRYPSILLVFVVVLIASCTKEGPEGPVGSTGPQGVPGANANVGSKGPLGDQGPNGAAGTANVIYSSWVSVPGTAWGDTTISTIGQVARANMPAPAITQKILDEGFIMVYHTFAAPPASPVGGANAQALPYSTSALGFHITVNFRPVVGRIAVFVQNVTSPSTLLVFGAGHFFRYVVIPGNVIGGRMMSGPATGLTVEQLQAMPYDQVIKNFNIPKEGANVQ